MLQQREREVSQLCDQATVGAGTVSTAERIKLGIACVYFYGEESGWLLDLQLDYLTRTLQGYDYTIYAGANRLAADLRQKLESTPRVRVVRLPWYDGVDNVEHAFYLDRLLWSAVEDGCTHLAAIDSDSFPIFPGWPYVLLGRMGPTIRLAAVLRSENLDSHLPHPCGYFMQSSFLTDRQPKLFPDEKERGAEAFSSFLRQTGQRVDTGIGYGYVLWRSGEPWLRLLRSNRVNLHFLLAGIYGDIFFHLGASSRHPAFYADYVYRRSLRLAAVLRGRPLLWRVADGLNDLYVSSNRRILQTICHRLKADPRRLISELAGDELGRQLEFGSAVLSR